MIRPGGPPMRASKKRPTSRAVVIGGPQRLASAHRRDRPPHRRRRRRPRPLLHRGQRRAGRGRHVALERGLLRGVGHGPQVRRGRGPADLALRRRRSRAASAIAHRRPGPPARPRRPHQRPRLAVEHAPVGDGLTDDRRDEPGADGSGSCCSASTPSERWAGRCARLRVVTRQASADAHHPSTASTSTRGVLEGEEDVEGTDDDGDQAAGEHDEPPWLAARRAGPPECR